MAINRILWDSEIMDTEIPLWPCPTCKKGRLTLKKDTLKYDENAKSKSFSKKTGLNPDIWDPTEQEGRFSALLICEEASCEEIVSISGHFSVGIYEDETDYSAYVNIFRPDFVRPSPDFFDIPTKTPKDVATEIRNAFDLFWVDPEASANRVRASIEALLNHRKIKRFTIKNQKRTAIALHHRIVEFQKAESEIGDSLMAIKWLGNAGSHAGIAKHSLERSDILDALEILDYVLETLFNNRDKQIRQMQREIIKRKGPRKKTKPRV